MRGPWLTVCIPTYNRAAYLEEILGELARQIRASGHGPERVAIAVSDNGSPDSTPDILRRFRESGIPIAIRRNERNLGINPNLCAACEMASGRHAWLLGDDELLDSHALDRVLALLDAHDPGLLLAFDTRYRLGIDAPAVFEDYRAFAEACVRENPGALTEQTLLSTNIFRADCYDAAFARASLDTDFPHMFGIVRALAARRAKVVLAGDPIVTTRENRPPPPDGRWVPIDRKWIGYLDWLRGELHLPELDPFAPTERARREMIRSMLRHPIRFVRANGSNLFRPSAWRFLMDRLCLRRRR